jgi:hypothetical protein
MASHDHAAKRGMWREHDAMMRADCASSAMRSRARPYDAADGLRILNAALTEIFDEPAKKRRRKRLPTSSSSESA